MFSMKPNWFSISELYNAAHNYTRSVYSTLPLSSKALPAIYSPKASILLPPCNIFTSCRWDSLNAQSQNHYVYMSTGSCQLPAPPYFLTPETGKIKREGGQSHLSWPLAVKVLPLPHLQQQAIRAPGSRPVVLWCVRAKSCLCRSICFVNEVSLRHNGSDTMTRLGLFPH